MSRPASVTFLAFGVFCLAVFNLLGVINGILRYPFVNGLPVKVSPIYLIASDAFWSLTFVGLSFGLWRLRNWGRLGALVALSLYVAQSWFNRFSEVLLTLEDAPLSFGLAPESEFANREVRQLIFKTKRSPVGPKSLKWPSPLNPRINGRAGNTRTTSGLS